MTGDCLCGQYVYGHHQDQGGQCDGALLAADIRDRIDRHGLAEIAARIERAGLLDRLVNDEGWSLAAAGELFGITGQRVWQIVTRAGMLRDSILGQIGGGR